jgi:hypothetical protein
MARYIDADKLIAEYDRVHIGAPGGARKLMVEAPTADVVPKKEIANVLCDLKIAVHNKAMHPNAKEVPSYVYLKVFDAILQNYLKRLEEKHYEN